MPEANFEKTIISDQSPPWPARFRTSPRTSPYNSRANSPPTDPVSSPPSTSPIRRSPIGMLRRNYSSTFTLIPEDREIEYLPKPPSTHQLTNNNNNNNINTKSNGMHNDSLSTKSLIVRLFLWWPFVLLYLGQKSVGVFMKIAWRQFFMAIPTFWLSTWLWIFWKILGPPLSFVKWVLVALHQPSAERNRKKRTVIISCGSTIQTLHMARNFYSAGTRVVVFEFEGYFGLARFSTAVSKFYTVPRPTPDAPHDYVAALCDIVEKEKASYYIPVCATSPAHFDALAKPHLELLGCSTFLPGAQEVAVLDDTLEVLKKCDQYSIPQPPHRILTSKADLFRLYETGWTTGYRNIMIASGLHGRIERSKIVLPNSQPDIKLSHEISDERPWVVVRDLPGTHYVTCTTVKDSQVIANVTCSVKQDTRALIPEENEDVENWLKHFFAVVRLQRPVSGHISFRLVKSEQTGGIVPFGTRVGVSLPYICHTGVHSRILYKPCRHFSRQNSGPLIQQGGKFWIHEAFINTLKNPSVNAVTNLIGTVLDKREVLFIYWDPLPYLAYYHFQLPFKSVKIFLQKRQSSRSMTNTLGAPTR